MTEVVERVAKLEERFDGMTTAIAELKGEVRDLKVEIKGLDARMQAGFAEVRGEFAAVRGEMHTGFAVLRSEMRGEMHTQFRWIMSGIGSTALAILLAILGAVLALR
jgi:hypothetical protein